MKREARPPAIAFARAKPACRPRALVIRDDTSSGELRRRARRESDGRVSTRLIAIANALDGMDRARAARLAGMDRQTLRDWAHRYNAEGIAGLCDRPKPKLTEGQMAVLKAVVLAGPIRGWTRLRGGGSSICAAMSRNAGTSATARPGCCTGRVARPKPPQDPAAPPAGRREGSARLQKDPMRRRTTELR